MSRPENMTPDEAEIWQRMELHGEELVRDMGAAMMQAERLRRTPGWTSCTSSWPRRQGEVQP